MGSDTFLNHNTENSPHRAQVGSTEWGSGQDWNPDPTLGWGLMQGCFAGHSGDGNGGQFCALGQALGFCEPLSSFVWSSHWPHLVPRIATEAQLGDYVRKCLKTMKCDV